MKRAFTLIEVMVVLSILAIIAILAYNFFGNSMKEASEKQLATKIHRDLTALAMALEDDIRQRSASGDWTGWPTYGSTDGTCSGCTPAYSTYMPPSLKAALPAPESAHGSHPAWTDWGYMWDSDYNLAGGASGDLEILLTGLTDAACLAYNKHFTNYTTIPVSAGGYVDSQADWNSIGNGNTSVCYNDTLYGMKTLTFLVAVDP